VRTNFWDEKKNPKEIVSEDILCSEKQKAVKEKRSVK